MCHVSCVTCHITKYIKKKYIYIYKKKCGFIFSFLKKLDKVVELVGGVSVINGATPSSFYIRLIYLRGLIRHEEKIGGLDDLLDLNNTSKVLDHLEEDEKEQEVLEM